MNKIIYILLVILTGGLVASCYEDKSKEAGFEIPEVTITMNAGEDEEILTAVYGKELVVKPVIKKGNLGNANLSYYWEINLLPGGKDLLEIGEEAELHYEVANEPSSQAYLLRLKVTDNDEGLDYYKQWAVYVSNSFGEGLVIAHTGNGGETSDLTFVKAPQVTYGYNGEVDYTRNIYSLANGAEIDGRVKALVTNLASNGKTYNISRLVAGTNKSVLSLDPVTFKCTMKNDELFLQTPSVYDVETISTVMGYYLITIIGGKAYGQVCNSAYQFSSPMNYAAGETQVFTGKLALEKNASSQTTPVTCYDETNGYFLYLDWMAFNNGSSSILTQTLEEGQYAFNPGNLPGKKALAAGLGNNAEHMHLLHDLTTGKDTVYKLSAIDWTVGGTGKISLDACENIANAVGYAFCENMDVMYYATTDKVYPVIFAGNEAHTGTAWTLPQTAAGERITNIQMYQQAWMGNGQNSYGSYPFTHSLNQRQLFVTTYNSSTGEGKIYVLPVTAMGTGTLGAASQVLDGFGEVTAIGTTMR